MQTFEDYNGMGYFENHIEWPKIKANHFNEESIH